MPLVRRPFRGRARIALICFWGLRLSRFWADTTQRQVPSCLVIPKQLFDCLFLGVAECSKAPGRAWVRCSVR